MSASNTGGRSPPVTEVPGQPIRVLIVDDHPIVREGLVAVLEDEADIAVAGTAGSAEEALRLAPGLQPAVVLLDLELPAMSGVEAISHFAAICPAARVVVLTAYHSDELVFGALRAGAKGYLLKGAPAAEIAHAIRTAHAGGSVLEPRVAARLVATVGAPRREATALSERERQVLRLVADGLPNKQIARALQIAERTVKFHIAAACRKLGADNRAQAAVLAIRRELL